MLQSPMKGDIFNVKAQLESCTAERNLLEEALRKIQYRVKNDTESNLSLQVQNYESRLTELHCIIVELRRQLDYQREHIIPEECTEDEMDKKKEEQVGRMIEDEYPGLPEPQVLSGDVAFTTTSASSPTTSSSSPSAGSPDQPTTSKEVGGGPEKSHHHQHRGREDINRRNVTRVDGADDEDETEDDVKREPNRRISVTRSRRRILQPSGFNQPLQSSQKSRKIPMDEGRYHLQSLQQQQQQQPMDNALHTGLSLRDLEMRAWRDGGGVKSGGKKGIPPGNPMKQQLLLLQQQQQQQQQQQHQYHHHQQQQRNSNGNTSCIPNQDSQIILHRPLAPQPPSSHPRLSPDSVHQFAALRDEVALIREEHFAIRESLFRKEGELDLTRSALENIAEERDFLKKKVYELELLLKQSPKKFSQFMPLAQDVPALPMTAEEPFTCKVAERVKLKQIGGSGPSPAHSTPTKRNNNNHHRQQQQHQQQPQQQHNSNNNNSDPESPCSNHDCDPQEPQHHHHHHQHTHQSIHVNMNSVVQVQGKKNSNHSNSKLGGNYISGQELVAIGNSCSTRLVEHLVQPLQDDSTVSELEQAFAKSPSGSVAEEKVREFEIETERLNSRLEHLRCQNDVLTLNLDDTKSHADRLTVLLGKYESNNVGHQIALGLSDQLIEAYDVLVALLESELGLLLANCRAAGIGASTNTTSSNSSAAATCGNNNDGSRGPGEDDFDVASLLHRASENRMTAEIAARNILVRMVDSPGSENNNGMMLHLPLPHPSSSHNPATSASSSLPPWEDASSCSQTLSSASSVGDSSSHSHHGGSSAGEPARGGRTSRSASTEKNEEQRVRDLIIQLKTDREAVRNTLVELETWSLEPQSPMQPNLSACDILEARKLDLETAVLMQELMAMREDRAELRAQLFLLEKDKGSLELKLSSYEAQQDAYKARMNHLKAELAELQESSTTTTEMTGREITETTSSNVNLNENEGEKNTNEEEKESNGNNNNNKANNNNPTEREMILKRRLQELASSLDKVSHNANLREHQSHETVNELKKANNILLENLESVKRKYQNRIRKMEEQIVAIVERHSVQMKLYKERVHLLEAEMIERSQHL